MWNRAVLAVLGAMMLLLPRFAVAADQQKLAYYCTRPVDNTHYWIMVYIDYSNKTAAASNINENPPVGDYRAHLFQSAKIDATAVAWNIWGNSTQGLVASRFTLNRTTSMLHVYEDLDKDVAGYHGDDYHCAVNAIIAFPTPGLAD